LLRRFVFLFLRNCFLFSDESQNAKRIHPADRSFGEISHERIGSRLAMATQDNNQTFQVFVATGPTRHHQLVSYIPEATAF
jgi:hypothetical protein